MSLTETVVDHIDSLSSLTEEGADLLGTNTSLEWLFGGSLLCLVSWEHVLWPINILAEMEEVDFFSVTTITVTANDKIKHGITGRHNVKVFHYTKELLSSDVLGVRAIKVLEAWLKKDPVGDYVLIEGCHHLDHLLLFLVVEDLF